MFGVQSIKCSYTTKSKSVSIAQNQQVGFFQYWAGSGWVLKKSWVASGFGSGRSVEIFDWVFPGTLLTFGYVGY